MQGVKASLQTCPRDIDVSSGCLRSNAPHFHSAGFGSGAKRTADISLALIFNIPAGASLTIMSSEAHEMPELATNILTGILIAAVSAWITVQLSLRRFRAEKWWEKRVAAYERVLDALHHAKAFSAAHLNAAEADRQISTERDEELRKKAQEANLEIERAADIGGFLLSDEALARLRQLKEDERVASETDDWYEYLSSDWAAANSCLKEFIVISKKDLQTK